MTETTDEQGAGLKRYDKDHICGARDQCCTVTLEEADGGRWYLASDVDSLLAAERAEHERYRALVREDMRENLVLLAAKDAEIAHYKKAEAALFEFQLSHRENEALANIGRLAVEWWDRQDLTELQYAIVAYLASQRKEASDEQA